MTLTTSKVIPPVTALPKVIRAAAVVLSVLTAVSGMAGLYLVWSASRYLSLGFEGTLIVAGVFGVLCGLNRFRAGPALALFSVGGAVLTCSVLSEPDLVPKLMGQTVTPTVVSGVNLIHLAAARVLVGLALCAMAGIAVLIRNPARSMGYLVRAALVGSPLVVIAVLSRVPGVMSAIKGMPPPVIAAVVLAVLMVAGACLSIAVHCVIRGFEAANEKAAA